MTKQLVKQFPKAALADLPTPIRQLTTFDHPQLFMKRDDLSGPVYGGNKIRKLEFLLGEALEQGAKTVITYGAAGSNHALATAVCCRQLGLKAVSILAPQGPSDHVRKNLLMGQTVGAELILCDDFRDFPQVTAEVSSRCSEPPYIIPAGGTNATSCGGIVRSRPDMASRKVTSLREGKRIEILEGTGVWMNGYEWYQIAFDGRHPQSMHN